MNSPLRNSFEKGIGWDPRDFSAIPKSEICRDGRKFRVRGKTFESLQEAEEYIYHINLFREAYSGPRPRVVDSQNYIWYVFSGILLLVGFLLYDPDIVEYKFESYEEAENAGIFHDGLVPSQIPRDIQYLLIRQNTATGVIWARFDVNRSEISRLLSSYKIVPLEDLDTISFPTTSGYPWGGMLLSELADEYGKNQVRVGVGECAAGGGYAILAWTGQSRDTFYGCDSQRPNKAYMDSSRK